MKKLAANFFCSMLSLVALNFLFIGVMLIVNPEYSHVSWPGAIFNNLFILAGSDIYSKFIELTLFYVVVYMRLYYMGSHSIAPSVYEKQAETERHLKSVKND